MSLKFPPRSPTGWWRLALASLAALLGLFLVLQRPPWTVFATAANGMSIDDFIEGYTWIAAVLGMGTLAFLALICPWWAHAPEPSCVAGLPRAPRWFWPLVAGAIMAGGALSLPMLSQSLEADECMSLRESILGHFRRVPPDGRVEFKNASWKKTVYGYEQVNNHILASIVARISNGAWRAVARPSGLQFSEVALRLPFFLAALASIAAFALMLRAFGHPEAGALAAWLIALHPWFERYTSLARGYALVFLLLPVMILAWRRGMLGGRWLWWIVVVVCEVLLLWAYPGMLFFLVVLNALTVALFLLRSAGLAQPVRTVASRWFCCNALAAVGAMPLMLPLFPQVRAYFDTMPRMFVGAAWGMDFASLVLTGRWWAGAGAAVPAIEPIARMQPLVFWLVLLVLAALLLVGLLVFVRSGLLAASVATAWVVAPVLQFFYARHEAMFIWVYYLIYLLPFVMGLLSLGLIAAARVMTRRPAAVAGAAFAAVLVFAGATHAPRAWQYAHSATLLRESTLLTRPDLDYRSEENRRILTAGITSAPLSYDANYLRLKSATELALLCMQAERTGQPLFLNQGHQWVLDAQWPVVARMILDPVLFEPVARMEGETATTDRTIVKYRPGGVQKVDWSLYLNPSQIEFAKAQAALDPEQYFVTRRPDAP